MWWLCCIFSSADIPCYLLRMFWKSGKISHVTESEIFFPVRTSVREKRYVDL